MRARIIIILFPTLRLSCERVEKMITLEYEHDLMFYPRLPLIPVELDQMWEILDSLLHANKFCVFNHKILRLQTHEQT